VYVEVMGLIVLTTVPPLSFTVIVPLFPDRNVSGGLGYGGL
jgi:hypothetical protein